MKQYRHVIKRLSHDEEMIAIISYKLDGDPRNAHTDYSDPDKLLFAVKGAVYQWVKNTPEGRACYDYAGDDLNIGDVVSHGGDDFVRNNLEMDGIHDFEVDIVGSHSLPDWHYDTVLVDPELGEELENNEG